MTDKKRAKFLLTVFTSVLAVDIISKWLVNTFLPMMQRNILPFPYGGLAIFENFFGVNFSLNLQTNTGAAWGIFPNATQTLLYIRMGIIGLLLLYTLFLNPNRRSQVPFIFIITGAVGNVLDTLFYGHVIDMFFFELWGYDFPVFNVADAFIFMGVAWLCILNLRKDKKQATFNPNSDSDGFNPPSTDA
ncbi:MAG: Lipoprotein signal peptidase [Chlamydiae bacterium]|nr:Lipoprotein signal peptidase [Chlamydiota bacterium]